MSAVAGMPPVPEPPAQSVATDQDPFGPPAFQVADAAWEWLTTPITAAAAESAIKAWPRRFWVWLWVALRREWRTTSGRVICIAAPPDGTDVKNAFPAGSLVQTIKTAEKPSEVYAVSCAKPVGLEKKLHPI